MLPLASVPLVVFGLSLVFAGLLNVPGVPMPIPRASAHVRWADSMARTPTIHTTRSLPTVSSGCLGVTGSLLRRLKFDLALGSRRLATRATQRTTAQFSGEGRTLDLLVSAPRQDPPDSLEATSALTITSSARLQAGSDDHIADALFGPDSAPTAPSCTQERESHTAAGSGPRNAREGNAARARRSGPDKERGAHSIAVQDLESRWAR
jgi:hypothetical protein